MKHIAERYKHVLNHTPSILALLEAFLIFIVSLVINYFASQYAFVRKGLPATDILLDNLPVVNMENAFVIGTWIFVIFMIGVLLFHPKKIPFALKTMALFIVVRSAFVTMTHIGPSPLNTLTSPSEIGRAFTSGADLFFSGHTGVPFLYALIYWKNFEMRIMFIVISVLAAIGVLFGHIHYTIDVASAYFITYGVYIIARQAFKKDFELFNY